MQPKRITKGLLETLGARSRSGLRLNADTNLFAAIDEWKRDTYHFTDRLNNVVDPPGVDELLRLHRRAVNWNWFWSIRCPIPAQRQRFAALAVEREAALEAILANSTRNGRKV
jgi:hypothetical protein